MTEYYWVFEDTLATNRMFWRFDNDRYSTVYDVNNVVDENKMVGCMKEILPKNVEYSGYHVIDFKVNNNFNPDSIKKLIVLKTTNGLSVAGPVWMSSEDPCVFMKDVNPCRTFRVG